MILGSLFNFRMESCLSFHGWDFSWSPGVEPSPRFQSSALFRSGTPVPFQVGYMYRKRLTVSGCRDITSRGSSAAKSLDADRSELQSVVH